MRHADPTRHDASPHVTGALTLSRWPLQTIEIEYEVRNAFETGS
jgi:hypothetical protein